jgi:hypothetical protein
MCPEPSPKPVDIGNVSGSQIDEPVPIIRNQAFKAVRNSERARNTIAIVACITMERMTSLSPGQSPRR